MLTLDQVKVKAKSAKRLEGLNPIVQEHATKLIELAYKKDIYVVITQGLRTIAEQNALYAQGRNGDKRPVVTNAKGGTSYHNYGLAIDFALLSRDGKSVSWEVTADWMEVVKLAKSIGFEWGGDFKSFKDMPHFQMSFGLSIKQLQAGKKPPTSVSQPIKEDEDVEKVNVFVNGKKTVGGAFFVEGSTFPAAKLLADLGIDVRWDNASKTLYLKNKEVK